MLGDAIREWRQGGGVQPGMLSTVQAVHDPLPSPTVSASRKKQKTTQSLHSQSFVGPSPPFIPQPSTTSHQPSSSNVKRGSVPVPAPAPGAKGKKHKSVSQRLFIYGVIHKIILQIIYVIVCYSFVKYCSQGQILPGASSTKLHPSLGRGQISNRVSSGAIRNEPVEGATLNPFIGKKVRTRWPEDNSFYEAVITDYNAAKVSLPRIILV